MTHTADTIWGRVLKGLFTLGATYLLAIVAATIWDVVARNTDVLAPHWLGTFVELGLPISTMLAAPYLVRQRGHVSMELIDTALSLGARRILILLTDVVAAGVSMFFAWYAWLGGYEAWHRGEIVILAVDVQRWTLYAVLAAGFTLCAVEFLRHAVLGVVNRDSQDSVGEGQNS